MAPLKTFLIAVLASLFLAAPAGASTITGLTKSNQIFTFDSATPTSVSALTPVVGLAGGDSLVSIDRNPSDGALYGLGSQSRFYKISDAGVATQVGPVFPTPLAGAANDLDFSGSGTARVVTDAEQNFTIQPSNGSQTVQTALSWTTGDTNDGQAIAVAGLAYSHNVPSGSGQVVYGYDFSNDAIVKIGGAGNFPSGGKLDTVGFSGVFAAAGVIGLDETPDGTLYALLRTTVMATTTTKLFTVNKTTGAVTAVGNVGGGADTVADIATDPVENKISFATAAHTVGEAGEVEITVKRNQSLGFAELDWSTSDATGTAGTDYDAESEALFFSDGQTEKTIKVRIQPDAFDEDTETFTVNLSNPEGGRASTIAPSTAVVQITDDDTGPVPSTAVTVLTTTNSLVTLDSAAPGAVSAPLAITGLPGGEELVGIDRRPATGGLYGFSKQSRLFRIDESSGAATQIGDVFSPPIVASNSWGVDFDPVADRLRIVSTGGSGQQLRVNPDDGSVVTDSPLIFNAGDQFNGAPSLPGIAYSDNVPGAASTTLWAYDYTHDTVARVGSPGGAPVAAGSGATSTIGPSRVRASFSGNLGFDVDTAGRGWALINEAAKTRLHLVDLATGEVEKVGEVATGANDYRDLTLPALSQSIQLGAAGFEGSEAAGSATVTVVRSQSRGAASIQLVTGDGSATAASDYAATNTTVTFGDGETSKSVSIPVANDTAVEGPETLSVAVSDPRGGVASLGGTTSATVTITSDDRAGAADTTKPAVKLCGSTKQDLVKQKAVVICFTPNEAGTAALTGKLTIKGVKKAITLPKPKTTKLTANKKATIKVTLSKKTIAQIKSAQKRRRKATAAITITVKDAAGNTTRSTRKVTAAVAKKKK